MSALRPLFADLDRVLPFTDRGFAVLTPNRRLARAVHAAYAEHRAGQGQDAWEAPCIMPLEQWLEERWLQATLRGDLPPRLLLDIPRQRRLWREIVEEDNTGFSLLGPAAAARRCQQARTVLRLWQVDPRSAAVAQEFTFADDSAAFLRWLEHFDSRCEARGLICPEDALAALLEAPGGLDDQRVLLLDSDELPPLHAALLGQVAEYAELSTGDPATGAAGVQSFPDARSELRAISHWCRARHAEAPGGRFAVVLHDMERSRELLEMFLRQDFDCLTRRYESLPVNFATGLTLDRVPLVRDALRILATAAESVSLEDFTALLHSRFVPPPPVADAVLAERLDALQSLGRPQLPARILRQVMEGCGDGVARMPWERSAQLSRQGRWMRRARTPSQWIEPFRAQLAAWEWPRGEALDSLEHQQFEFWQAALDALAGYEYSGGEISWNEAVTMLREHCAQTLFQPRTEDAAIQVLGPLETTGLRFDAMWIAGMSALQWPAAPRANPYIPRGMQKRLRMPRADSLWERTRAEARLRRWQSSAAALVFSYVHTEEEAAVAVSPLLAELDPAREQPPAEADPRWDAQAAAIGKRPVPLRAEPLRETEAAHSGVAAGVLQDVAACHFRAFAARRLGAQPREEPVYGISAAERGSLLHEALYRIFGTLDTGDALQRIDAQGLSALLRSAVQEALATLDPLRREIIGSGPLELERERMESVLSSWLALERERPAGFRVAERESRHELSLGGLTLRMRVDRVDAFDNGERLVIDYKSGRGEALSSWFLDPPSRPQLPLYALLQPPADGIAFAALARGSQGFKGVGTKPYAPGISDDIARVSAREELDDMPAAARFWATRLGGLAEEFRLGTADVDPHVDACRYCARYALCRLAEIEG